jgi:predicted HTH domain antitoxin
MERTKKLLAEVCFLLAKDFISRNEIEEARRYAEESIRLYEDLKIDSLERAVPELSRNLPEIMHEGVVKHQLSSLFQPHN